MKIYGHQTPSIQALAARLKDIDVGLRWGGPMVANAINGQVHLLNGLEQLECLEDNKIPIPPYTSNILFVTPNDQWLARKVNHTQGKDIIPVGWTLKGRRNWKNSDYFVKYVSAVREWRFHILKGQSIARGLKFYTDPNPCAHSDPIIRSRRLGWHLEHKTDPPKGLRTLAKAAVEALGYDLGAVDLLELTDGTGMILEVNSRPAIRDDYTLAAYETAIRSL